MELGNNKTRFDPLTGIWTTDPRHRTVTPDHHVVSFEVGHNLVIATLHMCPGPVESRFNQNKIWHHFIRGISGVLFCFIVVCRPHRVPFARTAYIFHRNHSSIHVTKSNQPPLPLQNQIKLNHSPAHLYSNMTILLIWHPNTTKEDGHTGTAPRSELFQ